jgi:hypothetical protein
MLRGLSGRGADGKVTAEIVEFVLDWWDDLCVRARSFSALATATRPSSAPRWRLTAPPRTQIRNTPVPGIIWGHLPRRDVTAGPFSFIPVQFQAA